MTFLIVLALSHNNYSADYIILPYDEGRNEYFSRYCDPPLLVLDSGQIVAYDRSKQIHTSGISKQINLINKMNFFEAFNNSYKFNIKRNENGFYVYNKYQKDLSTINVSFLLSDSVQLNPLQEKDTTISDTLLNKLNKISLQMYNRALKKYPPVWYDTPNCIFQPTTVKKNILVINFDTLSRVTVEIKIHVDHIINGKKVSSDDRSTAFFVINPGNDSIIYRTFGHGEWTSNPNDLLQLTSAKYFKYKEYYLATFICEYAWEGDGRCIMNVKTGTIVLETQDNTCEYNQ